MQINNSIKPFDSVFTQQAILKNWNHLVSLLMSQTCELSIANCLNLLRSHDVDFINLGNIVYCPHQKIILYFRRRILDSYDLVGELLNDTL